ncbi:unnamed protein product [Blepharisma stoltei]|uniref:Uncharacterized protein n=1 Tax=Blepharisma stoltei TaxID=1481888 RepID=A0AAU9K231_9CILI|nr:unnamed protein product [Blepharisma stoltei]
MLVHRIFRAFSVIRSPTMIPRALDRSRYTGKVLDVFETQFECFNVASHAKLLLKALKRTSDNASSEPETEQNKPMAKVLEDPRFDKFLKLLNETGTSFQVFLNNFLALAWVYQAAKQKFEAATLAKFIERVKGEKKLNLSDVCIALKVISIAAKRENDVLELVNGLSNRAAELIEQRIPYAQNVKTLLMLDLWKEELKNNHLLTVLEPYVLKYINEIEPKALVIFFRVYSRNRTGSKEFIKQLLFAICVKLKELQSHQISKVIYDCAYVWNNVLDDTENTLKLLYQEIMKKLGSIDKFSLYSIFPVLSWTRIGNPHYYELLGAQWVKFMGDYSDREISKLTYQAAEANLSSITLVKALNRALKPLVLNISPLIYEIYDSKVQAPVGLIEGKDDFEVQLSKLKQDIMSSIKPSNPKKNELLTISRIYETNNHSFFKFGTFIQFMWGFIKIADQTDIKMLDSETWNLLVQLLKKHVSELNRNDKQISYVGYDMLSQIAFLSNNAFQTISKITIPRDLADYAQHSDHEYFTIANSNRSQSNKDFENQFVEFCKESGISYHLPKAHSAEKSTKELIVGDIPFYVNAKAKNPVIVLREFDIFYDGYIRGLMKNKLKILSSLTPITVVRYDEWMNGNMNKDYFKKILQ